MGLRATRLDRKLTQTQLAERTGLGQPVIAMLERLRNPNPKWDTVARLSVALRTSPWKLFGTPRMPKAKQPVSEARA